MVEHVTFSKLQTNMSLKHGHIFEASSANRLGSDGRDRMIKKLHFKNGSDTSNRDEALTCLRKQLVR